MHFGDKILDSLYAVVIEWSNPNMDFMFSNKVTVFFQAEDKSIGTAECTEEFDVTAKVPYEGDPDLLEEGTLPEGKTMQTIALHLTNMNVYEEPIHSLSQSCH